MELIVDQGALILLLLTKVFITQKPQACIFPFKMGSCVVRVKTRIVKLYASGLIIVMSNTEYKPVGTNAWR